MEKKIEVWQLIRENMKVELLQNKALWHVVCVKMEQDQTKDSLSHNNNSRKPRARDRAYLHWLRCSRQIYLDRQEHLY